MKQTKLIILDQIMITIGLIQFAPFITGSQFIFVSMKYPVLFVVSLYLLLRTKLIFRINTIRGYILALNIIVIYYFFYCFHTYFIPNIAHEYFSIVVLCLVLYLYLSSNKNYLVIIRAFDSFILIVAIASIVSFILSNLGLLPTKALYLSNIKVGFNALLGLVHWKNFFYRPSFYFAEPSYLGFFLGFSFFFMSHQREKKGKSFSIPIVFLAGICTFSLTYLIGVALTLIVQLVNKTVFFKLKNKSAVIYLGVIAISSVYILSSQSVYSKSYLLDERLMDYGNITTSIVVRVERIKHSGSSLLGTPGLKILMGNGPGSLSGESNAWVKTIYEKGLLVLLALIFIIYNSLKSNIPLLVFTLITLHSVIILETPFFIFLLIISYTRDLTDKNPAN